tara:strand:+ start:817 stop:1476 length:660 start_codon:yes stop_codon:yes gene_type:complete
MRNTNLYFGLTAAATQTFDNVAQGTPSFQLTTGGFNNPVPKGENFIVNGGLKVEVTKIAGYTFGTGYKNLPANGQLVDISKACTIHATNGTITVATTSADPVNGFDYSGTQADNDGTIVTQLKPYATGHGIAYNSSKLVGIAVSGAATTALNFVDCGGTLAAKDTVTVTHGSAKHKEFMQELTDVVADDDRVSGLVVVRDDMRDINLTAENASEIASVA